MEALPAYERIANAIREEWLSGPAATPGRKLPTQRALQDRFGVSLPTISRALALLEAEGLIVTRHGSGSYIADLSRAGEGGNGGSAGGRLLSLIVPLRHDWLSVRVYRGVERRARELGFGILMGSSSFDVRHEEELVAEHLEAGAQGIILNPIVRKGGVLEDDYLAKRWREIPIVLIDLGTEEWGRHIVTFDNYRLGYDMTRELLRRGHRNILFMDVTPETVWRSIAERARGWRTAMKDAGVSIPDQYAGWPGVERVEMWIAGREGDMDELAARLLALEPVPDAVIAWEDQTAIMLTQALLGRGVDVPGDIRVTGFDDHDTARWFTPPFPTSRPGFTRAGEIAVDLVFEQLTGRVLAPRTYILPVPLVWREPEPTAGRAKGQAAPATAASS